MTAVGGQVREAVRRGDLGWLTAHLGARDCTPAVVRLLVRHDDPRLRHLGWDRLGARIEITRPGEPELTELAGLLPRTVDGPPETALTLARLYQRLWRYVPRHRRPQWRTAGLPAPVRIAWLRAEILNDPATVHQEPAGEPLYQAVGGLAAADADRPEDLVRELAASGDPVLHGAALRLAREGLRAALLTPARAREYIGGLPGTSDAEVTVAALRELAEPWAALIPYPRERLRPFLAARSPAPEPAVIDAAIAAATRGGHGDLLWDVVSDEAMPPRSRQGALRALGDLAAREDIPVITAIATADPLLLGGPALASLRAMHRRGLFPGRDDAAAIVNLALADHTISATEVATIMYTCREQALRALVAEDADDVSWPRRLTLLVGLARQGDDGLPVGDTITGVLPATSHPEPFLTAIRALRHLPAEAAVIDVLPRAPAAALHALEAIGGPRTVAVLTEGLGLGPRGDESAAGAVAPHLRVDRHRALELLWHLTDDPGRRRMILARLNPRDLPRRIAADLGAADPRELALLGAAVGHDTPVHALLCLARTGDAATLASIADILLRIVADLAAPPEPAGPARPAGPRDGRPVREPAVPDEVVTAISDLGRRLHERGKLRPFCLREAAGADEAGHALVATIVLDLLDRPGLSSGEQAILLAMLRHAPYPGTRARVHRLLRHRDRHVRKNVIALFAADPTGDDAQALSASLIVSAGARDGETVRQALLALGHVGARWAAPVIAACLDHPTMNIKKTAAAVLVQAGTPAAVPRLLFWLGRHDNPGLRATLIEALQAILGDAYPATVLAAAEQAGEQTAEQAAGRGGGDRTRELLLGGLDRLLPAHAVGTLARQGSPIAPVLLTLVAAGRVRLGSGSVADLAAPLAAHGIAVPAGRAPAGTDRTDHDIDALVLDGWHTGTARRIVNRHGTHPERPGAAQLDRLRPMLADWLRLAGAEPDTRPAALRFVLRLCPAPWTAGEIDAFRRATRTLVTGLADVAGRDRDDLLAVLEAVAPVLHPAEAFDVATRIRATAPAPAGHRSPLALLRRCGAVLSRADIEQALAAARLGPDPWRAETAVLREAFAVPTAAAAASTSASASASVSAAASAEATTWRLALETAVRTPGAVGGLRSHDASAVPSRDRLDILIDVFPSAGQEARAAMLDWMEALQPVGAPPWTRTENAHRPALTPRAPQDGDLDQPRSAAQRDRLLAILDAPAANRHDAPAANRHDDAALSRRDAAAAVLRDWPEPEITHAVLRAFLHGHVDVAVTAALAQALTSIDEPALRSGASGGDADAVRERAARVAAHLDPPALHRLLPLLLDWWEHGGPATRASVEHALRRVPEHADAIAEILRARLDAGAWGFLDLLAGRPLLRTPALTGTRRRLCADGRDDLAGQLILVDGPLRGPDAAGADAATLAAYRERPRPTDGPASREASRNELLDLIRTGHTGQVRRALTRLAEAIEDDRPEDGQDRELENLLAGLLQRPEPGLRLHAHRVGRKLLDRPAYLRHTAVLLGDPEPDVVRSAVETLSHAAYTPAIPAIVGLLGHPRTTVRRTAADGLVHLGPAAVSALRHAAGHARPDKRHRYTAVLDRITGAGTA